MQQDAVRRRHQLAEQGSNLSSLQRRSARMQDATDEIARLAALTATGENAEEDEESLDQQVGARPRTDPCKAPIGRIPHFKRLPCRCPSMGVQANSALAATRLPY